MSDPKQKRTFDAQAQAVFSLSSQPKKGEEASEKPNQLPQMDYSNPEEQSQLLDKLIKRLKKL